jgi:serine/threonine-protein kinase SRPK3
LNGYASLKISIRKDAGHPSIVNEVKMLRLLGKFAQEADHPGLDFTRLARDIFEVDGPSGPHYVIVTQPQGPSLRTLQETFVNAKYPKILLKSLVHRLWFSVNWLHATCGVIHTGMLAGEIASNINDSLI